MTAVGAAASSTTDPASDTVASATDDTVATSDSKESADGDVNMDQEPAAEDDGSNKNKRNPSPTSSVGTNEQPSSQRQRIASGQPPAMTSAKSVAAIFRAAWRHVANCDGNNGDRLLDWAKDGNGVDYGAGARGGNMDAVTQDGDEEVAEADNEKAPTCEKMEEESPKKKKEYNILERERKSIGNTLKRENKGH
jgi:hypothetical protein